MKKKKKEEKSKKEKWKTLKERSRERAWVRIIGIEKVFGAWERTRERERKRERKRERERERDETKVYLKKEM